MIAYINDPCAQAHGRSTAHLRHGHRNPRFKSPFAFSSDRFRFRSRQAVRGAEGIQPSIKPDLVQDLEDRRSRSDGLIRVSLVVQKHAHADASGAARVRRALHAEGTHLAA